MEDEFKPSVQPQRRGNPNIKEVVKKEVIRLLDAGLIYPISDSPWVSPVQVVPKKGGMSVVKNEKNELILQRTVTRWRVTINYRKLNNATRKDHFPLPFIDQMLERLDGHKYYYFLDLFSGYFQIPITPEDLEKTTFTCPSLCPAIHDKKGAKNLAADHLSRLENPNLGKLTKAEIRDLFPEERLMAISDKNNEPWKDWSHKLDDALWAFWIVFKTPLGTTPFRIIYGKACHLPAELEHKAYWAIKNCNMDLTKARANRFLQINELDEMRLDAYESLISYKERTKKWHDKRIKTPTNYEKGDKVLLFNSRLRLFPGKLKSRWYGPFSVSKDMKNGAIDLYNEDGNEFIVNKQRVKPYQKDVLDTNRDDDITLEDEGEVMKFFKENEKKIFLEAGDGVRIYPDGVVIFDVKKLGNS
ncbi:reverse transcriptase domain-containing protein [Tanacetum coccineum]